MAVTQQLARVTTEYLNFCRQASQASPDANPEWNPPRADWIDLGWSPESLRRLCQLARVGLAAVAALERSTYGDALVDVSYLDHDDAVGTFGPPPRALAPAAVAEIAATLAAVDWEAAIAALPADGQEAAAVLGIDITGDPRPYLTRHFEALRTFYQQAAERRLTVVLWWD
ncbi:DUF1877 family protein [Streptomyces sp. NBC_01104]|uniref:DUF1877 family protein n=1 Tax=Streptomyces sp. NBC_01104 TaxID=2903750 RepID=UPI00386AFE44|nr:YfbM family protein [Streptomyces sp. NBC_01104]